MGRSPRNSGIGVFVLLGLLAVSPATATDIICTFGGPSGGQWVGAGNWSCPGSPWDPADWPDSAYDPNFTYGAVINTPSVVTLNTGVTVGGGILTGLSIGASGATLRVGEYSAATLINASGGTFNAGTIAVYANSGLQFTGATGSHELTGSGTIALLSSSSGISIANNTLVNNGNLITGLGTITGTSVTNRGVIDANGGLLTINLSGGLVNATTLQSSNSLKLVNTTVTGEAGYGGPKLILNPGATAVFENSSLSGHSIQVGAGAVLSAAGGSTSTLNINTSAGQTFLNRGTLNAAAGSRLAIQPQTGGVLTNSGTIGGGAGNVALVGGTYQGGKYVAGPGGLDLFYGATIQSVAGNPVSVTVQAGGSLASQISGNSSIVLNSSSDTFSNQGSITAFGGTSLTLRGGVSTRTNAGTIQAVGGELTLFDISLNGGNLAASEGGTLGLRTASVRPSSLVVGPGSRLVGYGGAIIELPTSGGTFSNAGTISALGSLFLNGGGQTWNNSGAIVSTAGTLSLSNGTFQGGTISSGVSAGTINLRNVTLRKSESSPLTIVNPLFGTISATSGVSTIQLSSGDTFQNNGSLVATAGQLTLDGGGQTWNNGTLGELGSEDGTFGGGTLTLKNGTFTGGTLRAGVGAPVGGTPFSSVQLDNVTVQPAKILTYAGNEIRAVGGNTSFLNVDASNPANFQNQGTLTAAAGSRLAIQLQNGSVVTNAGAIGGGAGTVVLVGGTYQGGSYATGTGTLELFYGATIQSTAGKPISVTVQNGGILSSQVSGDARIQLGLGDTFSNQGSIAAFGSSTFTLDLGGQTYTNGGSISGSDSARMIVQNGTFQGGRFGADTGSTLVLNNATVQVADLVVSPGGTVTSEGVNKISTIQLQAGGTFHNAGLITTGVADLILNGGGQTLTNDGTIQASGGLLILQNGTFQGGTFASENHSIYLHNGVTLEKSSSSALTILNNEFIAVLGTGNRLNLSAGDTFQNNSDFYVYGELTLDGGGQTWSNNGEISTLSGCTQSVCPSEASLTLQNGTFTGGTVSAGRLDYPPSLFPKQSTVRLHNATVEAGLLGTTASGTIAGTGGTSVINLRAGNQFGNAGTITATAGTLILDGGGRTWQNAGTGYYYAGQYGTISANGGILKLQNGTFEGGTFATTASGGVMLLSGGVTLQKSAVAPLKILNEGGMYATGPDNTIRLSAGDTFQNNGELLASGAGPGQPGQLTLDGGGLTWTNNGTLGAYSIGVATLQNGTFNGGTLQAGIYAGDASTVQLNNVTVQPAKLITRPGNSITATGGNTSYLTIDASAPANFENEGTLNAAAGSRLAISLANGSAVTNAGTIGGGAGNVTLVGGTYQGGSYVAGPGGLDLFYGAKLRSVTGNPISVTVQAGGNLASQISGDAEIVLGQNGGFSNEGSITAFTGTSLTLDGGGQTWNNAGTIQAVGGTLHLNSGTFAGGKISTTDNGVTELLNVRLQGSASSPLTIVTSEGSSMRVSAGASSISLSPGGTFQNAGTLSVSGGALTLQSGTFSGGTMQTSGGELLLDSAVIAPRIFSVSGGATVASTGTGTSSIVLGGSGVLASFSNSGTIEARTSSTLVIDAASQVLQNGGVIRSNGGTLELRSGVFQGGTYRAEGGILQLNNASITAGGTPLAISTSASGIIRSIGGVNNLTVGEGAAFTNFGTVSAFVGTLNLVPGGGTLSNNGTLRSAGGTLNVAGNWLNGGTVGSQSGTTALNSATITGGTIRTDAAGTVTMASSRLVGNTFVNQGNMTATAGTTILDNPVSFSNTGSLRALGGTLELRNANITGTGTVVSGAGGNLLVSTGTNSIGGQVQVTAGALTIAPGASLSAGGLSNAGTVLAQGQLTVPNISNTGNMTLSGTVTLSGNLDNFGSLTMNSANLNVAGLLNNQFGGLMTASGTIDLMGTGTFTNYQTLALNGVLSVTNGDMINLGQVQAGAGQSLIVSRGLTNQGDIQLTGGAVQGQLAGIRNETGATISGRGTVSAAGFAFDNDGGVVRASGGTLTVAAGQINNLNGGVFSVDAGSTLRALGPVQSSGAILLNGVGALLSGSAVTNTGSLSGVGTVSSQVFNNGLVRAEGGQLILTASGNTNWPAGQIETPTGTTVLYTQGLATNQGTIALLGGRFDNNNKLLTNNGLIGGFGALATGA